MRTTRLAAGALLAAAFTLPWAGAAGAQTSSPTLTVSPADGVTPGSMVTVSGSGYAPGGGIYVQFCERPAGEPGTAGGRADTCNPDQADDHTVWKTPIGADGEFSVQLKVESTFGDTDCATTTCGVFTRKDHLGGQGDFSQDAFAPVTFAAGGEAPGETTSTTAPVAAGAGGGAAQEGAGGPVPAATETAGESLARTGASPLLALVGAASVAIGLVVVGTGRRRAVTD